MNASVEQYTYRGYSEAVAKKAELERLGYRVFTPYWDRGTWNIIWIPYDVMFT